MTADCRPEAGNLTIFQRVRNQRQASNERLDCSRIHRLLPLRSTMSITTEFAGVDRSFLRAGTPITIDPGCAHLRTGTPDTPFNMPFFDIPLTIRE